MALGDAKRPWEQKLHSAGARVEEDLHRLIAYINDEVVPDVRANGTKALRAAAVELDRLAQRMDARGTVPPQDAAKDGSKP